MKLSSVAVTIILGTSPPVAAGIIAYGLCQSACNAGYAACCAGAGAVACASLHCRREMPIAIDEIFIMFRNLHGRYRIAHRAWRVLAGSSRLHGRMHPVLGGTDTVSGTHLCVSEAEKERNTFS